MPARAADGDPQIFLSALAQDAATVLRDDGLNQATRAAAFRIILRRGFDVPAVSRFVLGRYWRRASHEQRTEFTQLFEDYLVAIYGRRLGSQLDNALNVTGHRADGESGAIVHSEFSAPNGPVIALDWRLKQRPEGWCVIDIMVEGVSMALAQRSEFTTVIRNSGGLVSGLLEKLRKKTQTLVLNQINSEKLSPTNAAVSSQYGIAHS